MAYLYANDDDEIMEEHIDEYHHLRKGVALACLAWLFFAVTWICAKKALPDSSISTLLLFRNGVAALLVLPWMIFDRQNAFSLHNYKLIFIRSFSGFLSMNLLFLALNSISLTDASLFINTAPLFLPFLFWIFLKRPINHKLWPGIIIGFAGVFFVLHPTRTLFSNTGSLYALMGGLFSAISILTTRLSASKEKTHVFLFYFYLLNVLFTLPLFLISPWKLLSMETAIYLVILGLFSAIGQAFLFKSLQYGKATRLAPMSYTAVVYSAAFDWLFWKILPDWMLVAGIVLIMIGGFVTIHFTRPLPKL